jgi:hypothetical protein
MTLDEAIKHAEDIAESLEYECTDGQLWEVNEARRSCSAEHRQLAEWLKELKQLKEQQPCEDCISREAAKNALANLGIDIEDYWEDAIDGLPSVKPEKCGKIICSNDEINCGNIISHVLRCKCSECHFVIDRYMAKFINYCPNCGAKMEG